MIIIRLAALIGMATSLAFLPRLAVWYLLSKKHKELMALAISIVTKCEPCIEWHVQQAHLAGATDEEIYETIDVAIEMGGGPAAAYSRFALNALDFHRK